MSCVSVCVLPGCWGVPLRAAARACAQLCRSCPTHFHCPHDHACHHQQASSMSSARDRWACPAPCCCPLACPWRVVCAAVRARKAPHTTPCTHTLANAAPCPSHLQQG